MDPADDQIRPDYGGAWIGGVVPALLDGEPAPWLPGPAAGARSVVLVVLDGLGWTALEAGRDRLPVLAGMTGGPITTVVPSTTSAALTSIATGLTPGRHGIVGFRMRVGGEILNVLQWRTASGDRGPAPAAVQPHASFGGRDVRLVTRSEFRGSGFSEAHVRGSTMIGWRTTGVLVEHCRRLVAAGETFVYAYYDGVDKVAHEYGLRNGFFDVELASADRLVGDLLAVLPPDCAVLVTADHGQVHVEADAKRDLRAVAPLVASCSGDGRFRWLHARPGASRELREAAVGHYGDEAWVCSREQVLDEGWLGPDASATVVGRLGDVVLAARAPVAFIDPDYVQESKLISFHGSLTAAEMLVPLVAARGTGPPA